MSRTYEALTKQDSTRNDLTVHNDGWAAVPDNVGGMIKGTMLKFKDGFYFADKTLMLPEDQTALHLAAVDVVTCWVHWQDKLPAETRITQPGQPHPQRDELGDTDQSKWPLGLDGRPDDPWKDTRYLYLVDVATAAEYTFTCDTIGGRRAVSDLKAAIQKVRLAHPGAIAVVKLSSKAMPTSYGPKPRPAFEPVDWKDGSRGESAMAEPNPLPPPSSADEMSDEIPF